MRADLRRAATFAGVGVVNTALDFAMFLALTRLLALAPLVANVVSFSLAAANSYVLNRLVTFSDAGTPLASLPVILRFALVTVIGLGTSSLALATGLALSLGDVPAKALSVAATFVVGYLLNRYLVFRPAGRPPNRPDMTDSMTCRSDIYLAVLAASLMVVAPVALVALPGLCDYVNHYVRLWLLAGGAEMAPLNQMYEVKWNHTLSAVAVDWVITMLSAVIPVAVLGPVALGLSFLVGPLGASLLNLAIFGRAHWWQVLIFLLAFGFTSTNGLMNFHISLGIALLATALDVRLAGLGFWPRLAFRMVMAGVLLTVHAFGMAFYFALIGGLTLGRDFLRLDCWRARADRILAAGFAVAPVLIPPLVLALGPAALPGRHLDRDTYGAQAPISEMGIHLQELDIPGLLGMIIVPIRTYAHAPDIVCLLLLVAPVLIALRKRRLDLHGGLLAVSIGLAIVSPFMPISILGAGWIEKRLPNMTALMMAASIQPMLSIAGRRSTAALALALLAVAFRTSFICWVWAARGGDTQSVERAIAHIPAGAAVLPMMNFPDHDTRIWHAPMGRFPYGEPVFRHLPTLAVMQRHAFVPTVFSAAGKQPLAVRRPWDEIAVPDGDLPRPFVLTDPAETARRFPYVAFWRTRFDYILLVNADMADSRMPLPSDPALLQLVADEGFARLYRIVRPAP